MPGYPSLLDLSFLGSFGFVLRGQNNSDDAGWSVASAGDINNDGYDDFIVGAPGFGSSNAGAVYVVFGKATPFSTTFLGSLTPADGFRIDGAISGASGDQAGWSVASAGDVNNDGYDDIIIGAERFNTNDSGAAYVIFGKAGGFTDISLATLAASDGFRIEGNGTIGLLGHSVRSAGDVNDDGYDDIIVGAPDGSTNNAGSAYVIFGKAGGFGTINVLTMSAADGFAIIGAALGDDAGASVSSAGDINNDGIDDLIVGAPLNNSPKTDAGAAYIIYGRLTGFGTVNLATLAPADGFRIVPGGDLSALQTGGGVSAAGDFNGDGIGDLIVGTPGSPSQAGAAYLIFGKTGGYTSIDLSALPASDGFMLVDIGTANRVGTAVSSAGDVNGDGFDDLIIGVPGADGDGGNDVGKAYVVFGHASGFGTVDLKTLLASEGFVIQGDVFGDHAGNSATSAGDINDDGYDDIIVGAPDALGSHEGAAYVIYGRSTADVARIDNGATDGRFATSFTEDGAAVGVVDGNAILSSGASISSMTIQYADNIRNGDRLTFAGPLPAGLSASGGFQSGITITGNGSAADYQLALSLVRYSNVGDNPTNFGADLDRNFRISIDTDVGTQLIGLTTIAVAGVDDPAVARDDVFGVAENASSLTGNVFTNHGQGADSDPDGSAGSFSVIAVNGSAANVGNAFLLPSGAILRLNADGSMAYEPNHAFDSTPLSTSGATNQPAVDSFTYTLTGGSTATVTILIDGRDSNDFLVGPAGPSTLAGGNGNDTYLLDDPNDLVIETASGGALDAVFVPFSYTLREGVYVEILSTTQNSGTGAIDLTGNEFANTIYGNNGVNTLRGGGGSGDKLIGLGGNDTYIVQGNEQVFEASGGGTDIIYTSVGYELTAGAHVEFLSTTSNAGTSAIDLTGNEFANTIYGNNGVNTLRGGGGGDVLIGLGGNDTYLLADGNEQVVEATGGGTDVVYTNVSHALASGQEIEILSAASNAAANAMDLTGNAFANTIYANNGTNTLNGGAGNDTLLGFGGADTFAFTTALGAGNVDHIADFVSGTDKIALDDAVFNGLGLGSLPAGAFATGSAAGDADDRIIYNSATGQLFFDADGNGAGAMAVLFATLQPGTTLIASDFTVI